MKKYLYAGTFDPPTLGHQWVLAKAPKPLVVAVADNPAKKCLFTLDERLRMVRSTVNDIIEKAWWLDIKVTVIGDEYLAQYAKDCDFDFVVRGVRSVSDFEYEQSYAQVNGKIVPGCPPHLLMLPPPELAAVSSSIVKSLVGPKGWEEAVSKYVSKSVLETLKEKFYGQ